MERVAHESLVLLTPAADPQNAHAFFLNKLSHETDPSDVYADMKNGVADFVLIDVRSPKAYAQSHAVGAINLPHPRINDATMADYAKDKLIVVYCWGPGCNGATKAAVKLSALGFRVKEMIGGIEYWEDRERYPVERGTNGTF
ncbi:MAG: rhodanese-like domain-containing protein [Anaerolineae bacterium]|nr:rhodanese-like domain-containing protein [Anaerolineae bacterium]